MPERIPNGVAIRVSLEAYLAGTSTPATGKTIAITISKNGAAFGNPSAGATNATEIGSGSYYVDLSTTDTGTNGPLIVLGTEGTIDNVKAHFRVVSAHNAGFDGVPDATAGANTGLPTVDANNNIHGVQPGTGTGQLNPSGGKVPVTLASTDVTGNLASDVQTIKTQTVTCAAGVTVNTNVGTTQPVNFTGTGATAYVKVDVIDAAGVAWNSGAIQNTTFGVNSGLVPLAVGTAQSATASTITLDASTDPTANLFRGAYIALVSGTGAGQTPRLITSTSGSLGSVVAAITPDWTVNPDATTGYVILPTGSGANVELWRNGIPNVLISGRPNVDVEAIGAGVITGASIASGALNGTGDWIPVSSVNIDAGTGYLQVDVKQVNTVNVTASTAVDANMTQILSTTLTETIAGQIAASFVKFFDVAISVLTTASVNQTIDAATLQAFLVKIQAAVYDSATGAANVLTLSNGATQTINLATGSRTTV